MNTQNLFSLQGRSALITGGSRGIGRMIAAGFLAQGARVYISARKTEACDQAAAELSALGPCVSLPADVSTNEGIRRLVSSYQAHEPALDILVNNAGAAWGAPFDEFPEAGWDKVVDLNLKSPFFLTQALIGSLRAAASPARPAKVIHIASIDGISVNPMETYSYAASKAGLIGLTKSLARELASRNVTVNAVAPGFIETDMTAALPEAVRAEMAKGIPAGRAGKPEDVANAVAFFAAEQSSYLTGQVLCVDGGMAM